MLTTPTVVLLTTLVMSTMPMPTTASDEVVGTWEASIETRRGNNTIVLEFTAGDEGLEGTFTARDGAETLHNVAYSDGMLTFQRNTESQGLPSTLKYSANVDGDTMSVTVSTPRGKRQFTAERIDPKSQH